MAAFWGLEITPGKLCPYVPPPDAARLRVSNACLDDTAVNNPNSVLSCKGSDGPKLRICRLRGPNHESTTLDLMFNGYTEFMVEGNAPIHLTGYFVPEDPEEDDGQEELQELLAQRYAQGIEGGEMSDDSEEDEDYDSDLADSSEEDDLDEELEPEPTVRIEELPHDELQLASPEKANGVASLKEQAAVAASRPAKPALKPAAAGGAAPSIAAALADNAAELEAGAPKGGAAQAANAAAKRSQPGGLDTLPVSVVAKDEVALKKRRAADAADEGIQKRAKADTAELPAAAAVPDTSGLSKSQQKRLKKKLQKEGGAAAVAAKAAAAGSGATLAAELPVGKPKVRKFENGFQIEELEMGHPDGKQAQAGNKVFVKYRGTLSSGRVFDETRGKSTFSFRLGTGEVIKGWDRGVLGMHIGDKRRLTIPPQMAYGASGQPPTIPPNATLEFVVELVNVK